MDGARRIYGWLQGHPNSHAEPIVVRQHEVLAGHQEVGFFDLLEIRFIQHFRKQNISLQSLRKAAYNARRELHLDHPFATSKAKYMTDRKEIFLHTAKEENDKFLLNLMTNQIELYEVLEDAFAKGVTFDPSSGIAQCWHPRPGDFPNILLNPRIAFGRPAIDKYHVPTKTLFTCWHAERCDYDAVADWYEVPKDLVKEAVQFEVAVAA